LIYGVHKSSDPDKNHKTLRDFISSFEVLQWTEADANSAGKIRAGLEKIGKSIGPFDLQIAGQAMAHNLILVTNNEKEFSRVKGLKIENWAKEV
jgi:tRNA(fMet)-specific endonuclease VapC